jgi:hypothetical protein
MKKNKRITTSLQQKFDEVIKISQEIEKKLPESAEIRDLYKIFSYKLAAVHDSLGLSATGLTPTTIKETHHEHDQQPYETATAIDRVVDHVL